MTTFVALFRGINVGGNRKVRMDALKALHEALGFQDVVTYIQSGNVVFRSDDADGERVRQRIEESFARQFGFHSEVFVRSSTEFQEIIDKNPFQGQPEKAPNWVVALFLAEPPAESAQDDLLTSYSGPEEIFIIGREVYTYYPEGIGRSKLTQGLLDKKLKTVGTARNWNTVLKLQELMSGS